jgi:hypothetical protein
MHLMTVIYLLVISSIVSTNAFSFATDITAMADVMPNSPGSILTNNDKSKAW